MRFLFSIVSSILMFSDQAWSLITEQEAEVIQHESEAWDAFRDMTGSDSPDWVDPFNASYWHPKYGRVSKPSEYLTEMWEKIVPHSLLDLYDYAHENETSHAHENETSHEEQMPGNTSLSLQGRRLATYCSGGYWVSGSSCQKCAVGWYKYGYNTQSYCTKCPSGKTTWDGRRMTTDSADAWAANNHDHSNDCRFAIKYSDASYGQNCPNGQQIHPIKLFSDCHYRNGKEYISRGDHNTAFTILDSNALSVSDCYNQCVDDDYCTYFSYGFTSINKIGRCWRYNDIAKISGYNFRERYSCGDSFSRWTYDKYHTYSTAKGTCQGCTKGMYSPALKLTNNKDANPSGTLGECEGDCDSNSDCGSGLICFKREGDGQNGNGEEDNGYQEDTRSVRIPGCYGSLNYDWDYCVRDGASRCLECGTWSDNSVTVHHFYTDAIGQTSCKTCPSGYVGDDRNQRMSTKCLAPRPHQYMRNYWTYIPFAGSRGYRRFRSCVHYADRQTRAILARRPETKNKASWAQSVWNNRYQTTSSGSQHGGHSEINARANCLKCPAGAQDTTASYSFWWFGASSYAACRWCASGKYSNDNTYQSRTGQTYRLPRSERRLCFDCPAGYSQPIYAQSSCRQCKAGRYTNSGGNAFCTNAGSVQYHGKTYHFWTNGNGAGQDDHCIKRPTPLKYGGVGEPMCDNGATCDPDEATQGFKCKCPPGYEGITCQREANYCATYMFLGDYQMCSSRVAPPGGTGRVATTDQYYDENAEQECANRCKAMEIGTGFTVDEAGSCQCSNNDCSSRANSVLHTSFRFIPNYDGPCEHGTCSGYEGGYECRCEAGWGGKQCDRWVGNVANPPLNHTVAEEAAKRDAAAAAAKREADAKATAAAEEAAKAVAAAAAEAARLADVARVAEEAAKAEWAAAQATASEQTAKVKEEEKNKRDEEYQEQAAKSKELADAMHAAYTNGPCSYVDGSKENSGACGCGTATCYSATGLYCTSSENKCRPIPVP